MSDSTLLNTEVIEVELNSDTLVETTIETDILITPEIVLGSQGKSAYEIWLDEGNVGTKEDFLSSGYTHPETHPADMIVETNDRRFITPLDEEILYTKVIPEIPSSSTWIIEHNLNKYPSVTIIDSGGNHVFGDINYIDRNTIEIKFTNANSGFVYLN